MATITKRTTTNFSWADFDRSALSVGDEISDTLKTGEVVTFVVMDDGVIGLKNCLRDTYAMNETWTNKGGYAASNMRRYLREQVLPLFPDELQAIIKPRALEGSEDMLWLFSEVEIFGEHDWTEKEPDRGTQFEYFKNPANRVKTLGEGGDPTWWWERSPYASNSTAFCNVHSNGTANANGASGTCGVCAGFYI